MAIAARSLLRSSALLRRAAAPTTRTSSSAGRAGLRLPKLNPSAPRRLLRSPVEASFCLESLLPLHTATAAAVMTSLLGAPGRGYGWLCEGQDETR